MVEMRGKCNLEISVNGRKMIVSAKPSDTLLYILREKLGLSMNQSGCANCECDECLILVDGWPVKACLMLAVEAIGHDITTIEGIAADPIQQIAFAKEYHPKDDCCLSSLIMNRHALVKIYPDASAEVLEEWIV